MVVPIGLYTQLAHDRSEDYQMMIDGQVRTVVILQPDANMVCKVWEKIKNHPGARIVLRVWDWDDGRKYVGDPGVYQFLRDIPIAYGKTMVHEFDNLIKQMRSWAESQGKDFPRNDQLICHLINEPDTNVLERQIVLFTESAVREAEVLEEKIFLLCFNFGTGHPSRQVAGPGTDPDWSTYQSVIDLINQYGHFIGLHEYYNGQGIESPSTNPWHVLRHTMATALQALKNSKVIIGEYGLEMLVNGDMDDHHGWLGVISAQQFGEKDLRYYLWKVAPFVEDVIIYANDLPDRTWKTFDAVPAREFVVPTMLAAWKDYESGEGIEPIPPEPPTLEIAWPADGILTQRFGENPEYYDKFNIPGHNGIDIAADGNSIIHAIADGVVEWVGTHSAYGNYIRIWHPQFDFHSFYAHLSTQMVSPGSMVEVGDPVGLMGNTGNSTGQHLHFEIRFGERYTYWDITEGHNRGRANPEAVYAAYGVRW